MSRRPWQSCFIVLLAALANSFAGEAACGTEPCAGYSWDVSHERALFAQPASTLPAGKDGASSTPLLPERLYQLQLLPQDQVRFVVAPGRNPRAEGSYAGLAQFPVTRAGNYRIAADAAVWIDVVADGKLVASKDFQAQHECTAPRKVVEFELAAAPHQILEISGARDADVRITITTSPAVAPGAPSSVN